MNPRIALLLLSAAFLASAACLPKHDDPIDYLQLPESVIVHMDVGAGFLFPPPDVPEFTLYGDGTLILAADQGTTLVQSRLSKGEIEDLLEFIENTGFFNFQYEQPEIFITDVPTTYFYVNTRDAANAVSAYALGANFPDGDEYEPLRRLNDIKARLDEIAAGAMTEPFVPETGELAIFPQGSGTTADEPWPFPQIDIAAAAPDGPATYALDANELAALGLADPAATTCWCPVEHLGRVFTVRYRPVLPHEENFPEFDVAPLE